MAKLHLTNVIYICVFPALTTLTVDIRLCVLCFHTWGKSVITFFFQNNAFEKNCDKINSPH